MARYLQRLVARAQGPRPAIVPFTGRAEGGPDDIVEVEAPPAPAAAPSPVTTRDHAPVPPPDIEPLTQPFPAFTFAAPPGQPSPSLGPPVVPEPAPRVASEHVEGGERIVAPMLPRAPGSEPVEPEPEVRVVHDTRTETVVEKRTETTEIVVEKESQALQPVPVPTERLETLGERIVVSEAVPDEQTPVVREAAVPLLPQPAPTPAEVPEPGPALVIGRLRVDVLPPERSALTPPKSASRARSRSAAKSPAEAPYSRSSFGLGQM